MGMRRQALANIQSRIEKVSLSVHNGAWGRTTPHGQATWRLVGVRVYDRLHVRVWGRLSRE